MDEILYCTATIIRDVRVWVILTLVCEGYKIESKMSHRHHSFVTQPANQINIYRYDGYGMIRPVTKLIIIIF